MGTSATTTSGSSSSSSSSSSNSRLTYHINIHLSNPTFPR